SSDNLLSNYQITRFTHDVTLQDLSNGNAVIISSGQDLSLDHHGNIPYENLFSNLNMGLGNRTYSSSGTLCSAPHAGARETFWNLKYENSTTKPGIPLSFDLFPQSNVVGANLQMSIINRDVFMENIDNIEPVELYDSQFKARVKREGIQIFQKGDINEDGKIDAVDFRIYTQAIFGNSTEYDQRLVDIFDDGKLNLIDIVHLL
ncbi:MAG: dockerin type I domain-containing protein, partial [Candidatus Roizmanbacteria bacterium]|nr:dockerin type I domain-containing protein [Candidatus Roizmanbacteria bacterium]